MVIWETRPLLYFTIITTHLITHCTATCVAYDADRRVAGSAQIASKINPREVFLFVTLYSSTV